ncbi:DUF2752 domain-containing protein [Pedobacter gandavensis]|uniref:DUF2752 domain-containing protein n=1 Tax=Pedobacter gandavensis TaxID=2679963 RepID=UPI00292EB64F|nr:DUF2752 domain-containing protein [Pedobacter gandavensis]
MIYLRFGWSSFIAQADRFFIPCPIKYLTGLDCPGCGFQRAILALIHGQWQESFQLYPPTIPLLLTFSIALPAHFFAKGKSDTLIKVLFLITGTIILINYGYKVFAGHLHA